MKNKKLLILPILGFLLLALVFFNYITKKSTISFTKNYIEYYLNIYKQNVLFESFTINKLNCPGLIESSIFQKDHCSIDSIDLNLLNAKFGIQKNTIKNIKIYSLNTKLNNSKSFTIGGLKLSEKSFDFYIKDLLKEQNIPIKKEDIEGFSFSVLLNQQNFIFNSFSESFNFNIKMKGYNFDSIYASNIEKLSLKLEIKNINTFLKSVSKKVNKDININNLEKYIKTYKLSNPIFSKKSIEKMKLENKISSGIVFNNIKSVSTEDLLILISKILDNEKIDFEKIKDDFTIELF